jgi:DNA repair protein RadD
MSLTLRSYQREAVESIYRYFEHKAGNPLVVIPTAGGKSCVMASFIREALTDHPGQRILVVTHVRELIEQNFRELKRLWPEAPAGIYSAGLKQRDIHARVLFAGIQSIHARVYEVQQCDLVLIDEAHLIPRASNTMYRRFLDGLQRLNPQMKVIGFTATPYRLDSGVLHGGKGAIFTDIAFEVSVRELIDEGYLARLVSKKMATTLDVAGVAVRGGEFVARDLAAAVDRQSITEQAAGEIMAYGALRQSWLVFCAGVDHAHHVRDAIRARGIRCETIIGEMPSAERESLISAFKAGQIRCLTNANVLTTGFNVPQVDLIAMLRPTKSVGLYVQIVGRGCRLAPGKENCLVLDFAGNIARHGPIDAVVPSRLRESTSGAPPTKTCPECASVLSAASGQCPDCGFTFEMRAAQISARASELEILSANDPEWVSVTEVRYVRHEKVGKPPSLRVDYSSGLSRHSEWVCFEHAGYPRQKAEWWWRSRAPGLPVPKKVDEAIAKVSQLRPPSSIAVRPDGRYSRIVGVRFG